MKIYTKTGDRGETSLIGNVRVPKDHIRVEAYGALDEATSTMGLARSLAIAAKTQELILTIQEQFIHLSAEVASANSDVAARLKKRITVADINAMEKEIDWLHERKQDTKGWVLPGACPAAAALDIARCVVRRAERLLVKLNRSEPIRGEVISYINRLSDLLYALARYEEWEFILRQVKEGVEERLKSEDKAREQVQQLDLNAAQLICKAARDKADSMGIPVVIAILDRGGNLLLLERQVGALPVSIQLAQDKAYTAFAVRKPTHEIFADAQPNRPLYGLQHIKTLPITVVGGGFPLVSGSEVIGSLGVSGGTVEQDIAIAEHALVAVDKILAGTVK